MKSYSETELHAIKTGFGAIESLWRDISMGSDKISVTILKSIHQQLGEIGSELFRRIFLCRGQLLQVNLEKKMDFFVIHSTEALFCRCQNAIFGLVGQYFWLKNYFYKIIKNCFILI